MVPKYDVVIKRDSDGCYVASVLQLPGFRLEAESTQSAEDLELEIREAIAVYLQMGGKPPDDFECSAVRVVSPKTPPGRGGREARSPHDEEK
jgi:predicted RNase H-like HicB family nuclease